MIIDLLILLPWVGFGVLGFRDASVRKLVAIATCILGLFLGQWLMHDLGDVFRERLHVQPSDAPMDAFLAIFFFLFFIQSIVYRFATGNYKIGGIVDRIFGVALGLVEGAVFISVVIFILTMNGPPSRRTIWDSRLYHPTAAIAPRIMDMFSSAYASANQSVHDLTVPETNNVDTLKREDAKADSALQTPRQ